MPSNRFKALRRQVADTSPTEKPEREWGQCTLIHAASESFRVVFYWRSHRPASTEFRLKGSDVCNPNYCFNSNGHGDVWETPEAFTNMTHSTLHNIRFTSEHAANVSTQLDNVGETGSHEWKATVSSSCFINEPPGLSAAYNHPAW